MKNFSLGLIGLLFATSTVSCATTPDRIKTHLRESQYTAAIHEAEKYLAGRDEKHRAEVRVLIDVASYRKAEAAGTPAAYLEYTKRFPLGRSLGAAKAKRARLLFEEIRNTRESIAAYQEFLAEFPKGHLPSKARERIIDLSWSAAKESGRHEDLRTFREKFPDSDYEKEACLLEAGLFLKTLQPDPNSRQLRGFAARYPSSPLAAKAEEEAEKLDWAAAGAAQSVTGWVRYLRDNPESKRLRHAQQKLEGFPWMERVAGQIAGSHEVTEMVLICDRSGTSVINPWTRDQLFLSHLPVASCHYSPKGKFLSTSVVVQEARNGAPAQVALHVQDLTSNSSPVQLSTPSEINLCLMGMADTRCDSDLGLLGRRGHGRTTKGKSIPMVGVLLPGWVVIELSEGGENPLNKKALRSIRVKNMELISSLLERIDYTQEDSLPVRSVGQVVVANKNTNPEFDGGSFMSPAQVVLLPGGRAAVNIAEGCYQSDFVLFDLKTRHLISAADPKIRNRAFTNDIEVTGDLFVSKGGAGYIALGCWHDFDGSRKLCEPHPARFLGESASISLF